MVKITKRFIILLLATCFMHVGAASLKAQKTSQAPTINRESKIKAAYLYNFARYVEWPSDTFKNPKESFVIGVIGTDPIRKNLEKLAKTRTVEGRPIRVQLFIKPNKVTSCHILFFSPTLKPEVQRQIIKSMAGKNVLFVGQTSDFLNMGGVIDFVIQQNRISLVVDLESAQRENLKVSSKLLRVAKVIR